MNPGHLGRHPTSPPVFSSWNVRFLVYCGHYVEVNQSCCLIPVSYTDVFLVPIARDMWSAAAISLGGE